MKQIFILLSFASVQALASLNCYDQYWGTKAEPDYKGAYECFEHNSNLSFLAIMNFNGQGVPQNPVKAFEIAKKACASCPNCDGDIPMLLQVIDERTEGLKTGTTEIQFREIAVTTPDMSLVTSYDSEKAAFQNRKELESLKQKLTPSAQKSLDLLQKAFDQFSISEANWLTHGYRLGSIRGQIFDQERIGLMTEFKKRIREDIYSDKVPVRTSDEMKKADSILNEVYQKRFNSLDAKTEAEDRKELKLAQRHWIQLRDSWAAFQVEKQKGKQDPLEVETSQKTLLTEARIQELQANPDCKNPQALPGSCPLPKNMSEVNSKSASSSNESAQALFDKTDSYFKNKFYPKCKDALALLKKSAEMGLPAAMNRYGFCLGKVGKTPLEKQESINWYKKAADAGDFKARLNYVNSLTDPNEKQKAIAEGKDLAKAAKENPHAHLFLYNTDPQHPDSLTHLKLAAEAGIEFAELQMALSLLNAQVPLAKQDPIKVREAQKWASKAASHGLRHETFLLWLYSCNPASTQLMPRIQ